MPRSMTASRPLIRLVWPSCNGFLIVSFNRRFKCLRGPLFISASLRVRFVVMLVVLLSLTSAARSCAAAGVCSVVPCYHPLSAWWDKTTGSMDFSDRGRGDRIDLPCGQCIGCRLERSRQWATRIMFESQMHEASSFITLTYDDEHVPFPPSLDYSHFQLFMKRIRKFYGPLRFYMCGEYGENFGRPHFHACIFGTDFPDRTLYRRTASGHDIFRSSRLESFWPFGFSSVAELNFQTAGYVARYCLKKVTGDDAKWHYAFVDGDTGEISMRVPEFARMSLKPGIGGSWFDKYRDVDSFDYVVINGRKCRPPRYFDKLLKRMDPKEFEFVKDDRHNSAALHSSDNTDSRLAVREIVQYAALRQLSPRGDL